LFPIDVYLFRQSVHCRNTDGEKLR
jgi:hypothetical protein